MGLSTWEVIFFYVEVGLLFTVIVRKCVFNIISGFLDLDVGLLI